MQVNATKLQAVMADQQRVDALLSRIFTASEQTYESPRMTIARDSYFDRIKIRREGSHTGDMYLSRTEAVETLALLRAALQDDAAYRVENSAEVRRG